MADRPRPQTGGGVRPSKGGNWIKTKIRDTKESANVPTTSDPGRGQPRLVVSRRGPADRRGAGPSRRLAEAGVAGGPGRPRHRPDRRRRGLADAGRARAQLGRGRRRPCALAGDVDRGQCAAALQHRGEVRPVRRLPRLGHRASPQRPARGAGRHRLLLRRAARGHRRVRHAGGDHQLAAHSRGLPARSRRWSSC